MFTREWTVRFGDVDVFGIGYYPRIVEHVHHTGELFLEDIGYPLWTLIGERRIGVPIVECGFDFKHPVRHGDTVTIELTPLDGKKSVRFEFTAELEDGTVAFTAFEQRVCLPVDGDTVAEFPEDLRRAFESASSHG